MTRILPRIRVIVALLLVSAALVWTTVTAKHSLQNNDLFDLALVTIGCAGLNARIAGHGRSPAAQVAGRVGHHATVAH